METQTRASTQAVVPQRSFEALLADLDVTPALVQALRAAGFELERPRPAYPAEVWRAALQLVRAHLFPHLSEPAGLRALGRRNTRGFLSTPVGSALGPSIQALDPARLLARLPRLYAVARPDVTLEVHFLSERDCRVDGFEPGALPEMLAGSLEFWFERSGATPAIEVEGSGLRVRW